MRTLWIALIGIAAGFAACGTPETVKPPTPIPVKPSLCSGTNVCSRACCHLVIDCKFGLTIDGVELSEASCEEACEASDPIWECFGRMSCSSASFNACAAAADAGTKFGYVPDGGNPPKPDAGDTSDAGEADAGTDSPDGGTSGADAG